jgi:MFS family permease
MLRHEESGMTTASTSTTGSNQSVGWMMKAVIVLSGAPLALGYAVVVPILPGMSAAFAHGVTGEYMVKMVFGVLGPAMVLGGAFGGYLADKVDRRVLLTVSSLLFAAAGAAPFVLGDLAVILATRFLMGVAAVIIGLIGSAMVGDYFEEGRRAGWLGAVAALALAGSTLALPIAGAVGEAGWRWPFLIYLMGLPIAALAWLGVPRRLLAAKVQTSEAATASGIEPRGAYPIGLLFLGLIIGALATTPGAYMPFRLSQLGQNTSAIGFMLMLNALAGAGAAALYGTMRRRLSIRLVFCCGYAALGVGLAILALTSDVIIAIGALLVMGLALGWLTPNLPAVVVAAVDESRRGRALGAVNAAAAIAPAVCLTALEPVARLIGVSGVLLLTAALSGVMLLATLTSALAIRTP